MKKILFILSFVILGFFSQAQNVLDGVYIKEHTPERKTIPYAHLREADVMWKKRIWRVIDLREKINQPLFYPTTPIGNRKSFMQTLYDGVMKDGTLTAYDPFDDEFKKTVTVAELNAALNKVDTLYIENADGIPEQKIVPNEFDPAKVVQIRVKEEWFFDRQRSVMDCRILGFCPITIELNSDGSIKGFKPLFWVYYPEAREVFAKTEVYNRGNDAERRTMEDIIWKRQFGSYIYKESNVYNDRRISEYSQGIDALLEADRVKTELFIKEHDLWEY